MEVQKSIFERSVSEEWELYQSLIGQMLTRRRMVTRSKLRTSPSVPRDSVAGGFCRLGEELPELLCTGGCYRIWFGATLDQTVVLIPRVEAVVLLS